MLAQLDTKKLIFLGAFIALGLIAIGSFVILLSWHFGLKSIVLYSYPKPIIVYNTALCFLLTSGALGAKFFKNTTLSTILCCFSGVLCFFTLLEYIFSVDLQIDNMFLADISFLPKSLLFPGRISLNSTLCFLLINTAILLSNYLMDYQRITFIIVFFVCGCMGISITALIGYGFDMETAYKWHEELPGMSLLVAVAFINMSFYLLCIINQSNQNINILPIGVIYIGLTLSILVANNIYLQQNHVFHEQLDQIARRIKVDIYNSFSNNMDAFKRMVNRWNFGAGYPDQRFLMDSTDYVNSVTGVNCIQKLSSSFSQEFISPNCRNPFINLNSVLESVNSEAEKHFSEKKAPFISKVIEGSGGRQYLIIYYLLLHKGVKNGYLLISIDLEEFIAQSVINPTTANYFITLWKKGSETIILNKQLRDSVNTTISGKSPLNKDIAPLTVEIWPLLDDYNHFTSMLPRQVLGIGFLLSFLMSYALYLRSLSITRSRELETLNTHLKESESHLSDYSYQLKEKVEKLTETQKTLEEKTVSLKQLSESFRHLAEENQEACAIAEFEHHKALKANAAKNRFLTHINHEIRTPLNSMIGFTEMIREEAYGPIFPSEYKRYLDFIYEGGKHLSAIIEDFLDFSLIESEKIEPHPYLIASKTIIQSCEKIIQELAKKKSITIHYHINENCPFLYVDPRHMKQIVLNLLTNAIKFTPEKGEIFLVFQTNAQKECQLTIQDTGMGIEPSYMDKIFDPFGAAHTTEEGSLQSSGLGMYLIKSLVEVNKGKISIKSKVKVGTNITIILPPPPEGLSLDMIETEETTFKKNIKLPPLKILVAEDNKTNQEFIYALLESNGHKISFANNGTEAVNSLKNDYFDVVLMDLQMPVMNGDEATRQIRGLPSIVSKTPIIAITASTSIADKEKIFSSGMNGYLTKPIRQEALLLEIKRCLNI